MKKAYNILCPKKDGEILVLRPLFAKITSDFVGGNKILSNCTEKACVKGSVADELFIRHINAKMCGICFCHRLSCDGRKVEGTVYIA